MKLFAASRRGEDIGLGSDNIAYTKLDISSSDSIKSFANEVSQEGSVDVLINNAGVNLDNEYGAENAKRTLDVNYRGTLEVSQTIGIDLAMYSDPSQMCKRFIPLLSPNGRIVNISSVGSTLSPYHKRVQERFRNPDMSFAELEQLAQDFEVSFSAFHRSVHQLT